MAREVPRTVQSFMAPYQRNMKADDIEIIVLENGSSAPIPAHVRAKWGSLVRYVQVPNPSPSPAKALNLGVRMASAPVVCPVIDGARMSSPGLLHYGLKALQDHPGAFVASVGFHLGSELQQKAVLSGYNQDREDELLASIDWENNGYRLFEIAAAAGSAQGAWFGQISESNAPLLLKEVYNRIGGYDPTFDIPGGGLINLDFFERAMQQETIPYAMLIGEGTFHQFHGGVTTSRSVGLMESDGRTTFERYADQYEAIRGKPFSVTRRHQILYGTFPPQCYRLSLKSLEALTGSTNE